MLTPGQLHDYQRKAILHQLYHDKSMLWLGCGLGKTIVSLSTVEHRIRAGQVKKVLVFGPVRVIHSVWTREARKWTHTQHLRFSIIGWPTEKKRLRNLFSEADIYLCNYENMAWLANVLDHYYISQGKPLPFDMVIYDEITRVKNSTSQRIAGGSILRQPLFVRKPNEPGEQDLKGMGFKGKRLRERMDEITRKNLPVYEALSRQFRRNRDDQINATGQLVVDSEIRENLVGWRKMIPHIKFTTGLTGTPSANGYIDLHGQYLVIDGGARLGEYVTHYRDSYFMQGHDGWTYTPSDLGKRWIEHKISDITIQMAAEDYKKLPPLIVNDIVVELPPKAMAQYEEVERDMFTRLDDGTEIELFNRASVSNKCLQFANGGAYKDPGLPEWTEVHHAKFEALDSIIEEAQGKPILLGYSFKFDAEQIMKRYKRLNPVNLTGIKPHEFVKKVLDPGNRGEIQLMIGHPMSCGHGIDGLDEFCKILVWFGLPWSLELYEQMIGRIAAGERFKESVTMHRILAARTLDLGVADALRRKDGDQVGLKRAIQRYRDGLTPKDGSINFM